MFAWLPSALWPGVVFGPPCVPPTARVFIPGGSARVSERPSVYLTCLAAFGLAATCGQRSREE
jgi:hypothetical protein